MNTEVVAWWGAVVGQIKLGMESTSSRMLWAGEQLLASGKIVSSAQVIDQIVSVNADEILRLAEEIFDSSRLAVAGVSSDIESFEGDLKKVLACL